MEKTKRIKEKKSVFSENDMANNVCKSCGANLVYRNGRWVCPACGLFKEEELNNEEVTLLYNAEQKLRLVSFDEAEDLYKDIIKKYPENAQGYWGLLLAKYGIKYEIDYDGTQKPTCYAVTIESVQSDPNYQKVLDLCKDKEEKRSYIEKAKEIEKIRVEWLEKASMEPQYDVFICYKDSDKAKDIGRTDDSWDVADLYHHLKDLGYKVFYSRESLREKASEKWEPYIYQAINTASVMLVYGSKTEYFESTWMKNEWTRYFRRMREGKKVENSLLVAYAGKDPENLPKPLNAIQIMDAGRKTFYGDLEKQIARIIAIVRKPKITVEKIAIKGEVGKKKTEVEGKKVVIREIGRYDVPVLTPSDATKLKTAQKMLVNGLFDQALKTTEEVIEKNPQNGQALLLQFLADRKIVSIDKLSSIEESELNQIEKIVEYIDKKSGEILLRKVADSVNFTQAHQETLVAFVLQYNFTERDSYINKWIEELIKESSIKDGDKIFSEIFNYIDKKDIDTHISLRFRYAEALRNQKSFTKGKSYYEEVLAIDESHLGARWGVVCCEIKYADEMVLSQVITNLKSFDSLENLFKYCTPESKLAYLDRLISAISEATNRDSAAIIIFDRLIQYYTEEENVTLLKKVSSYAHLCQELGAFENAEKYYALTISLDDHNQDAYWGLMQAKLKCRTNDDLIKQPVPISEMSEFSSAIAAAGEDDRSTDRYIALAKAQLDYQKEQEEKRKKQRKIKKRISIIAVAVTLVIAIIITAVSVVSVEKKKVSLNYFAVDNGYSVVAGEKYKEKVARISATYNGSSVTEIADNAFANNEHLEKVVIPASVTKIGKNAFAGCISLEEVVFAQNDMVAYADSGERVTTNSNVTFVGENAFEGCKKLRKIDLQNATQIEKSAFRGCESLTSIELSQSLETLQKDTFRGCRSLRTIELPENLISVEDGCFANCETLQEISIPASVTSLGEAVFSGCTELKTIALDSENTFDAKWTEGLTNAKIGVTVYLDYNDATEKNGNDKVIISTGEYYTLPIPTKEGYTFIGWFTARTDGEKVATAEGNSLSTFNASSKLTYYARFVANTNTIIFDANGGVGTMENQQAETGSSVSLNANTYRRDGYSFAGWGTTKLSVDYIDEATYRVGTKSTYTLYAIWTPNKNTLSFNANGGEGMMDPMTINTDATAALSENLFTKKGYKFIGWAKTADGSVEFEDKATYTMGTLSAYTLYAVWEIETYTITYDLSGGTANNKTSYTILTETFQIENPTKTGYEFIGWMGTGLSDATMTLSMSQGSTGNKSFTANWIGNQNTLSFNANNGEGHMNDMIIRSGESAALLQNSFTRKGYDFVGWALAANGKVTYEDKDTYEMGTLPENTLYAVWSIVNYSISYELNKGMLTESNRTSYTVETDTFTFNEPERAGYTFTGWTGTELNSATKTLSIEKGSIGNRAYTANWQANLNKLSLHANGGEGSMDDVMIHTDETVSLPANQFTRKGYTFAGWSIATAGETGYNDEDEYTMGTNAEYHLYAHWSIITYTLTFELNNGTVASNKTSFTVETTTFTINNPHRSGYEFIGWSGTGLNEETITVTIEKGSINNRSYVANWQANLNTLSFNANSGEGNMDDMQIRTDETAKLSPNLFTKTGYHFVGWARTNYGTVAFDDEDNYTMGSSSQYNLYAKWEPNSNTLAFYGNGSTYGVMEPIQINTDTTVSLPVCSYEKEGYSFIGWATSALGDIAYIDQAEYTMGTDPSYSLYAKWQINQYTITIEPNGGAVNKSSITQDYNTVVTAPTISRTGYDFVDWYEDSTFNTIYNFATMQAKDVTAYAKWQMKTSGDELTGIRTPQELQDINTHLDGNFYLENDIDAEGLSFVPIGEKDNPFIGTFDGREKTIYNLSITGNKTYAGLFGVSSTTIRNVNVEGNYSLSYSAYVGGIVGQGDAQNCSWNGSLYTMPGYIMGGIVGEGNAEGCTSYGTMFIDHAIFNSYAQYLYIGGIVGHGNANQCYSNMRGQRDINIYAPGIADPGIKTARIGQITGWGSIQNCYSDSAFMGGSSDLADTGFYKLSHGSYYGANEMVNCYGEYESRQGINGCLLKNDNHLKSRYYMVETLGWDESIWCFGYGNPVFYGKEYIRIIYNNVEGLNNDTNPSGFKIGSDGFTLASVSRTGYTFGGWHLDDEYTQPISKIENLSVATNVYAKWTPNTYSVVLNAIGGTINNLNVTLTYDKPYSLETPTKKGYTFNGWYNGTGNTATAYTDEYGNSISDWTIAENDMVMYANWQANLNKLSLHTNGGEGNMNDVMIHTDETVSLPANQFTRKGYTFAGWSVATTGETGYNDEDEYTMGTNAEYHLYAHWSIITYTLTYELNGGTVATNKTSFTVETTTFTINNPYRSGYEFLGWTGTELNEETITVTIEKGSVDNRSYIANWQANLNTIIFNGNGSESGAVANITGYTDEYVRLPNNKYQKPNNEFKGWALSQDSEIVAYDRDLYKVGTNQYITLYAIWKDWSGYTAISTVADLKNIKNNLSGKYYLVNDIDFNGETWEPIGDVSYQTNNSTSETFTSFKGILDGNGFSIYNYKISIVSKTKKWTGKYTSGYSPDVHYNYELNYAGLFISNEGTITNLNCSNVSYTIDCKPTNSYWRENWGSGSSDQYIDGYIYKISAFAVNNTGNIINCSFDSSTLNNIGNKNVDVKLWIAYSNSGLIQNCYSPYSIGTNSGGGKILQCYSSLQEWYDGKIITYTDGTHLFYSLLKGNEIIKLTENFFVKEGYHFVSWSTTQDELIQYINSDEFEIDVNERYITLYPIWEANNNVVIFNANGGTGEMSNQIAKTYSSIMLDQNSYSKLGYHFIGWSTKEDGEVEYLDKDNYVMGTDKEYILYAQWEENLNVIVFVANGASGIMPNQNAYTDTTITLNPCSFIMSEPYLFMGWSDAPDGEVLYDNCASYNVGPQNTYTLYAVWKQVQDIATEFNGHYYKLYDVKKNWTEAKEYCESLGGHLVTITSAEEQAFIETIADQKCWIGATDENVEGQWEWVTGELWDYINWADGEPNDYSTGEDYAAIFPNTWNDLAHNSTEQSGFICEWDE